MKYLRLTLLALGAFYGSASAQTTYIWSGPNNGNWGTAANWTPNGVPGSTDEAVFNTPGSITVVPTSASVAKLTINNGALVKLSSGTAFTLTITGGSGTDLSIAANSGLDISSTAAVACSLQVNTGATGVVNGDLKFNSTANAGHKCLVADANALSVYGSITQGLNVTGNLFGSTGTANVVAFKAGSSFIQLAGANPFGLTAPSSKIALETGSWFRIKQNSAPAFANRTYANIEFNFPTFSQNTTAGNPFNADTILATSLVSWTSSFPTINIKTLIVNAGIINLSGPNSGSPATYTITQDITVNNTAILNLAPPNSGVTPGTVRLSGMVKQKINKAATATINVGPGTMLEFNNPSGFELNTSLVVPTALKLTLGRIDLKSNMMTLGTGLGIQTGTLLYNGSLPCYFTNGSFKRWFDGTQDVMDAYAQTVQKCGFPLGTTMEKFVALGFTTAPTTGGTITARYFDLPAGNTGLPYEDGDLLVNYMGDGGYWNLTPGDGMVLGSGKYNMLMLGKGFSAIEGLEKMTGTYRTNTLSPWIANGTPIATIDAGLINPFFAGNALILRNDLANFGDFSIAHALTAYSIGGSGTEKVYDVAVDIYGNRYVSGTFSGTVDFDPSANVNSLTSATPAGFVARYTNTGALSWVKMIGGNANSIAIDNNISSPDFNSVIVTGDFTGNGGAALNNLNSAGSIDCFVARLDSTGNTTLAFSIGDRSQESGASVALDAMGNIYITGFFNLTVDFDPGTGVAKMTSAGVADIFVAAYSSTGNYLWANKVGDTAHDKAYGITVGPDAVYATGSFQGSTLGMTSVGTYDVCILKYDLNGNLIWAKNVGGSSSDQGNDIALDAANNLYVSGFFRNTTDFDPNAGVFNLSSLGANPDGFILSLDTDGNFRWAKSIGGTGVDVATGISVSATDLLLTGTTRGKALITGGSSVTGINDNIFVARLDLNGNILCVRSIGGSGDEQGLSIAHEGASNYFLGGSFSTSMVAEYNDAIQFNFNSAGASDAFVMHGTTCVAGIFKTGITEDEQPTIAENISTALQTRIYPNPNNGLFTVAVNQTQNAQVQVMDMTGKVVYNQTMTGEEMTIQLNVPTGIYLVKINTETEQQVQKIIIQ